MYSQLEEMIEFGDETLSSRRTLLVSHDAKSDSSFVLHCALASHLRGERPALLVNVTQTIAHYQRVALKSGLNLKTIRDSGLLKCIDFLSSRITNALEEPDLQALYLEIKRIITALSQRGNPVLLLVDDVTAFLSLGSSMAQVAAFVHYCKKVTTLSLFGAYEPHSDDAESRRLLAFLRHRATLSMQVCGLQTGHNRDVHGHISFVDRKRDHCRTFQYKLEEKKVSLFPVGTSAAVL